MEWLLFFLLLPSEPRVWNLEKSTASWTGAIILLLGMTFPFWGSALFVYFRDKYRNADNRKE
jgi:hypothetical protein